MSRSPLTNIDEMFKVITDACNTEFYTVELLDKNVRNINTGESIIRFVITSKDLSICSYSRSHNMKIGNSYGDDRAYISNDLYYKNIHNVNELVTYIDDYLREYSINYRTFKK